MTLEEWLAASGFALAGAASIARGLPRLLFANAEESWRRVDGVIRTVTVDAKEGEDGSSFEAHVEYTYSVDGVPFPGSRIAPLDQVCLSEKAAVRVQRRYAPGQSVQVYVNPDEPRDAVLEPGRQIARAAGLVVLGVLLCAVALAGTLYKLRTPD